MARTPIWKSIAESLTGQIAAGQYVPGGKLPTEAELANRFGVNRHTVRHALKAMAEQGLVHARRGAGVFVTQKPTVYPLGRRVRFHQSLSAAGQVPEKRLLSIETRRAAPAEEEGLALGSRADVHVCEGLSLADGQPIAVYRSVFPAARLPSLPEHLRENPSVTAALAADGVADYTRAWTNLTAKRATAVQALHLQINEGAPILRSVGVNVDLNGAPVEFGHTWFAGDLVTLTVADD
ncbi:MAG: phosphonate metabolism transcriptional regulator PhnF [Pseudomonadota bacterium]